jgi:hypothetical protein
MLYCLCVRIRHTSAILHATRSPACNARSPAHGQRSTDHAAHGNRTGSGWRRVRVRSYHAPNPNACSRSTTWGYRTRRAIRSFRLARVIRIRHDVSGSCSVHSDVSDLREEMVWSGYQARVGFDASFDASFRAFFRASFRASVRGQMAFEVRKCETTSSARLHLKVRKCGTTSV